MAYNSSRRGSKCRFISKRLYEIRFSNEVLSRGLSELEALYLSIQSGKVQDKNEAKESASILSGQNHYLAQAINSALQEVESILRQHVEGGSAINRDTIHEFSEVLKESIRILHDYQLIQESYCIYDSKSSNTKSSIFFNGKTKTGNRRRKLQILQRVIQSFCICGTGINVFN